MKEIACFISPHGFGHATRVIAIIAALQKRSPDLHPVIFTTVSESLFSETLTRYTYHPVQTDIGLEQKSAMEVDLEKTVENLAGFLPFPQDLVQQLASLCSTCTFILCDIAPLGIAVARAVDIPSILVENFTWDLIYEPHKELDAYARLLRQEFARATYRIQTEPLCLEKSHDLHCGPIFRTLRNNKLHLRKKLSAGSRRIVVITMGGIDQELPIWHEMAEMADFLFVILGQQRCGKVGDNILLLEQQTTYYHPDLINCADLVVCKSGYSTIAECFQAGVRVMTVGRENFPESKIITDFVRQNMSGITIHQSEFFSGRWLQRIDEVLALPKAPPARENGADRVAAFLQPLLDGQPPPPSSIVHEFGNPLMGVTYLLKDLIERPDLSKEDHKLLLLGLEECRRMKKLLEKVKRWDR